MPRESDYITVELRRADAEAIALGGLDYVTKGETKGGSPRRARITIAHALGFDQRHNGHPAPDFPLTTTQNVEDCTYTAERAERLRRDGHA